MGINYALLCIDGFYNMGPKKAMQVAEIIKAKRFVPIHSSPKDSYNQENVDACTLDNKVVLKPGESIFLLKG